MQGTDLQGGQEGNVMGQDTEVAVHPRSRDGGHPPGEHLAIRGHDVELQSRSHETYLQKGSAASVTGVFLAEKRRRVKERAGTKKTGGSVGNRPL